MVAVRLYSFTPLTPPERRTSRDLRDLKDNASVAGSDVPSDFDPAELTFTQSQHNLTLNNLNASTSSTSSILSTGSVTPPTPLNGNILSTSLQRRDSTARLKRGDSVSVTGHALHHRDSGSQLHSQFVSPSIGAAMGPINPPTTGFGLSQSVNFGTDLVCTSDRYPRRLGKVKGGRHHLSSGLDMTMWQTMYPSPMRRACTNFVIVSIFTALLFRTPAFA
jgi:hypothetical protein